MYRSLGRQNCFVEVISKSETMFLKTLIQINISRSPPLYITQYTSRLLTGGGGGWGAHAGMLGALTFLLPRDHNFTVRNGGTSESAVKLP